MPRKATATIDDVGEAKSQLQGQIATTKIELERSFAAQLAEAQRQLTADVENVRQSVQHLDDNKLSNDNYGKLTENTKEQVAQSAEELRAEIEALRPVISDSVQRAQEDLEQKIADGDMGTRSAVAEELEELCSRFDQLVAAVRRALEDEITRRAEESAQNLATQRGELDSALEHVRQEAATASAEVQRVAGEELQQFVEAQEEVDKKQDKKAKSTQSDNEIRFMEIDKTIQDRAREAAEALQKASSDASTALEEVNIEATRRFEGLDEQLERLWASFNDVENVPTRKVEWVVKEAVSRLKPPRQKPGGKEPPEFASWESPAFDAAGARGMKLELRVFRALDPPVDGQDHGDCAVLLHAPKGTQIAFTLSIGTATETFEYKFNSDKPLGSQRLCFLKEQVDNLSGTLRVGLEVLECIYEFDKQIPVSEEEAEGAANKEVDEEEDPPDPPLDASFALQRHTNNRILDQVKIQMDYFKNRMTRRIEWRLEQASMMKRSFPRGAPMCSRLFDAAGITGLQLLFYPSGADGSGEGFCSAYVLAPAGTTLKSWLQVGTERRDINFSFEKAGQLGKANFCRFEHCVDEQTDSVLVVFDITEAHVELHARMHHPPPAQLGVRSFARDASMPTPLGSTLKIQRTAETLPPILQEVKVLPSLWTAKNTHDAAVKVNGLGPLKERGRGPRSGARRSPSSPLLH